MEQLELATYYVIDLLFPVTNFFTFMTQKPILRFMRILFIIWFWMGGQGAPLYAQTSSAQIPSNKIPSARTIYVSHVGNDAWSGTLAEPNAAGTDGPLASPEKAREIIRALNRSDTKTMDQVSTPLRVQFREGTYVLASSLLLEKEDSGTAEQPIYWENYPGEAVHFVGGKALGNFMPVRDTQVLARLPEGARDKVMVSDLKVLGITSFGEVTPRGGPGLELFFKQQRMPMSRWPNQGWAEIVEVPQQGTLLYEGDKPHVRFDRYVGRHYGRFNYAPENPSRWTHWDDILLHGYWTWDWFDEYLKIDRIDPENKEIWVKAPHSNYGYTKAQRFYALNILEELDQAGEWYLDRREGRLYFWPTDSVVEGSAYVSLLQEPLIILNEVAHVSIRGITLEYARGNGVQVNGGAYVELAGVTIRNIGGSGVTLNGGVHHTVQSCTIHDIGGTGVHLSGGDRKTLTPGNHTLINNHIHHYSTWVRTYQGAVNVNGVGNRIAHNLIHDAPHLGILVVGNENIFEYNELHTLAQQTGDVGAFYIGRDWTQRGNVLRHNYFHHLLGPGLHGVMAVYLDDWASATQIVGNVFYKAHQAVFIGSGRDNLVQNNLFIESKPSVHVDARGLSWASYYFDKSNPLYLNTLFDRMDAMNFREPPYSTRYPELLSLYEDEPVQPKNNRVLHNISLGGTFTNLIEGVDFKRVHFKDNLIADPIIATWEKAVGAPRETYHNGDVTIARELEGNLITQNPIGHFDPVKLRFTITAPELVQQIPFSPIPFEKIGLYIDAYRKEKNR